MNLPGEQTVFSSSELSYLAVVQCLNTPGVGTVT